MNPDLTIYDKPGDYAAIPWAIRLKSGRILLAFRIGTMHMIEREGRVVVCWSDDGGQTWSPPQTVCDHPGWDDREPAMAEDSQGVVWMCCMGQNDNRDLYTSFLLRSFDQGRTWTAPHEFSWHNIGFMLRHPFMEGSRLRWLGHTTLDGARSVVDLEESPAGWDFDISGSPEMGWGNEWHAADTPAGPYAILREAQTAPGLEWFYGRPLHAAGTPKRAVWHGKHPSRPFLLWLEGKELLACAYDQRAARRIVVVPSNDYGLTWDMSKLVPVLQDCPGVLAGTDFGYPTIIELKANTLLAIYWGYCPGRPMDRAIYGSYIDIRGWGSGWRRKS